jgi:type I restriction enzyme R subunit
MEQIFAQYPLRAGACRGARQQGATATRDTVLQSADYALFYKPNIPLADCRGQERHDSPCSAGMQQAHRTTPSCSMCHSAFPATAMVFVFRDATLATGVLEQNLTLEEFPSP